MAVTQPSHGRYMDARCLCACGVTAMDRAAQALGATLYTLLLSAHPYGGDAASDIYAAALAGPPFFPQAGRPLG